MHPWWARLFSFALFSSYLPPLCWYNITPKTFNLMHRTKMSGVISFFFSITSVKECHEVKYVHELIFSLRFIFTVGRWQNFQFVNLRDFFAETFQKMIHFEKTTYTHNFLHYKYNIHFSKASIHKKSLWSSEKWNFSKNYLDEFLKKLYLTNNLKILLHNLTL